MKRQRGRGRNKSNGQQHHGHHNHNRNFESNGPDVKIRGSASHVYEKYQQLARDASSAGDRIAAESYLQHAEHYFRLMRSQQQHQQRDRVDDGQQRDFSYQGQNPGRDEFDDAGQMDAGQSAPAHVQPAAQPHQPQISAQPQLHQPAPVSNGGPLDVVDPEAVEADGGEPRDEARSRRRGRRRRYEGGAGPAAEAVGEGSDPGATAFDRASNS